MMTMVIIMMRTCFLSVYSYLGTLCTAHILLHLFLTTVLPLKMRNSESFSGLLKTMKLLVARFLFFLL